MPSEVNVTKTLTKRQSTAAWNTNIHTYIVVCYLTPKVYTYVYYDLPVKSILFFLNTFFDLFGQWLSGSSSVLGVEVKISIKVRSVFLFVLYSL